MTMSAEEAMLLASERAGLDAWAAHKAIVTAACELYDLSLAGVNLGDDIWLDVQGRMFDAVQRLRPASVEPLASVHLLDNRRAEALRRDGEVSS